MDTSVLLLLGLAVLTALGLTLALRDHWWASGVASRAWNAIEVSGALFLMLALLYATATQVIARFALSEYVVLIWTEELSRLLLVWVAFWGAAMVQRSDGHMAVSLAYDLLSPRARFVVRQLGDVAIVAFLALVVWHGWWAAQSQIGMPMITLPLSSSLYAFSVPTCGALMILHTVILISRRRMHPPDSAASGNA